MIELKKKIKLLKVFYSSFALFSLVITVVCLVIAFYSGGKSIGILFWLKLGTSGLIYFFQNDEMKHEYYYYKNLWKLHAIKNTSA
ncbi:hypothetical protein ACFSKL_06085 [Belliella marina]|uniref:Uncharacterized protein n=1 Tax=Belliella marina TaxID=1644146 RepID=A0ABW4VNL4_9BACT